MKYCILTKDCHIIDGYNRSVVLDFTRENYLLIPHFLSQLFNNKIIDIDLLLSELTSKDIVDEYLDFLNKNDMLIYSDSVEELERFRHIELDFLSPLKITNAIIEESALVKIDENLISQLTHLDIQNLEIRTCNEKIINDIGVLLNNSKVINLEIISDFDTYEKLGKFWENNTRIRRVYIYSSDSTKIEKSDKTGCHLIFTKESYSNRNCGVISVSYFNVNIPHFTESQAHNTCLNRKLCIDTDGNIKNCPAMERSFGNIKDTTLPEAIEKPGFKDLWFIHKDLIDVCKDCEFRHTCTDCRCFIKDSENIYSQPAKCTYNPYICKWEGQEGYVPVEECGNYGRETGFVPNHKKIKELNKQIWGEDDE